MEVSIIMRNYKNIFAQIFVILATISCLSDLCVVVHYPYIMYVVGTSSQRGNIVS